MFHWYCTFRCTYMFVNIIYNTVLNNNIFNLKKRERTVVYNPYGVSVFFKKEFSLNEKKKKKIIIFSE